MAIPGEKPKGKLDKVVDKSKKKTLLIVRIKNPRLLVKRTHF